MLEKRYLSDRQSTIQEDIAISVIILSLKSGLGYFEAYKILKKGGISYSLTLKDLNKYTKRKNVKQWVAEDLDITVEELATLEEVRKNSEDFDFTTELALIRGTEVEASETDTQEVEEANSPGVLSEPSEEQDVVGSYAVRMVKKELTDKQKLSEKVKRLIVEAIGVAKYELDDTYSGIQIEPLLTKQPKTVEEKEEVYNKALNTIIKEVLKYKKKTNMLNEDLLNFIRNNVVEVKIKQTMLGTEELNAVDKLELDLVTKLNLVNMNRPATSKELRSKQAQLDMLTSKRNKKGKKGKGKGKGKRKLNNRELKKLEIELLDDAEKELRLQQEEIKEEKLAKQKEVNKEVKEEPNLEVENQEDEIVYSTLDTEKELEMLEPSGVLEEPKLKPDTFTHQIEDTVEIDSEEFNKTENKVEIRKLEVKVKSQGKQNKQVKTNKVQEKELEIKQDKLVEEEIEEEIRKGIEEYEKSFERPIYELIDDKASTQVVEAHLERIQKTVGDTYLHIGKEEVSLETFKKVVNFKEKQYLDSITISDDKYQHLAINDLLFIMYLLRTTTSFNRFVKDNNRIFSSKPRQVDIEEALVSRLSAPKDTAKLLRRLTKTSTTVTKLSSDINILALNIKNNRRQQEIKLDILSSIGLTPNIIPRNLYNKLREYGFKFEVEIIKHAIEKEGIDKRSKQYKEETGKAIEKVDFTELFRLFLYVGSNTFLNYVFYDTRIADYLVFDVFKSSSTRKNIITGRENINELNEVFKDVQLNKIRLDYLIDKFVDNNKDLVDYTPEEMYNRLGVFKQFVNPKFIQDKKPIKMKAYNRQTKKEIQQELEENKSKYVKLVKHHVEKTSDLQEEIKSVKSKNKALRKLENMEIKSQILKLEHMLDMLVEIEDLKLPSKTLAEQDKEEETYASLTLSSQNADILNNLEIMVDKTKMLINNAVIED